MATRIAGLATGIGSLPYVDPEPALRLIKENVPQIPHWPQLPRRTAAEGFTQQFLGLLRRHGALGANGKSFTDDAENWAEVLTNFFTFCLAAEEGDQVALAAFAPEEEAAAGFFTFCRDFRAGGFPEAVAVKGQIVGPLTVGFQLVAASGRPAYYEPQLRELIRKNLALAARWQTQTLQGLGCPVLLFIDEPAVSVYGQSTYITVTREQILDDMGALVAEIKNVGAVPGVHSCAAVDWSILLALEIDILSFDAYGYFESLLPYRRELAEFLARGGLLAWGIVPTSEAAWEEGTASLVARLRIYWKELAARGIPLKYLETQYLITPSCGTGILPEPLAERIYTLTRAVTRELWQAGGE